MRRAYGFVAAVVLGCSSSSGGGGGDAPSADAGTGADAGTAEASAPHPEAGVGAEAGAKVCKLGAECGDGAVCDPDTATCVAAQCDIVQKPCAAGKTCAQQVSHVAWGACYTACVPFPAPGQPTGCPTGYDCEIGTFDAATGTCRKTGATAADQSCTFSDVSTACAAGYTCQPDPQQHFCRQTCDFFAQNGAPTCARADLHCMAPGVCYSDKADPAKLGDACTGAQNMPCGLAGQAYQGVCAQDTKTPGRIVCSKWCRSHANDCPASQQCQPTNMPSLGYCQ
jgi:hypothetical protein